MTPYILRYVSREEYGLYLLCIDFLSWMSFLQLGTAKVLESTTGKLIGEENYGEINKAYNTTFFFQLGIALFIIPFYYILVTTGIQKNSFHEAFPVIIIIFSVSAALELIRQTFSALLIASKKIYIDNSIQIVFNLLNFGLILLLVPYLGLLGLAMINIMSIALMLIRSNIRVRHVYPAIRTRWASFDRKQLVYFLKNGIYFSLGTIATILIMKMDSYFIGLKIDFATVAYYFITIKLFVISEKLIGTLLNNFRPYIAQMFGRKEFANMLSFYELFIPVTTATACVIVSVLMVLNQYFVNYWVGADFFLGSEFGNYYAVFIIFNLMALPCRIILSATLYRLREHSFLRVAEGILRFLFIVSLFAIFHLKVLPISSLIASIIFGFVSLNFLVRHFFQSRELKYSNKHYLMVVAIISALLISTLTGLTWLLPSILLLFGIGVLFYNYQYKRQQMLTLIKLIIK
ncbi:MAG: hypothetical protein JNJ58_02315 [Chitinophagaceae bacterium]|nr:hypothetical protein [Chitinophagaceae bacterium]